MKNQIMIFHYLSFLSILSAHYTILHKNELHSFFISPNIVKKLKYDEQFKEKMTHSPIFQDIFQDRQTDFIPRFIVRLTPRFIIRHKWLLLKNYLI